MISKDVLNVRLSMKEAEELAHKYIGNGETDFKKVVEKWQQYDLTLSKENQAFTAIRDSVLRVFKEFYKGKNDRALYLLDLEIGLILYEILNPSKGFNNVIANNDDFWRYLSMKVFPDITYIRYPATKNENIRSKRFYSATRRIWVKTLWWYIHLGWQGSYEKTREVLNENNVDNINKLLETPGKGYRLSLYRTMMLAYHETRPHEDKTKDFASFTQLNNAKCVSIEPNFFTGGETGYARSLLKELADHRK